MELFYKHPIALLSKEEFNTLNFFTEIGCKGITCDSCPFNNDDNQCDLIGLQKMAIRVIQHNEKLKERIWKNVN